MTPTSTAALVFNVAAVVPSNVLLFAVIPVTVSVLAVMFAVDVVALVDKT